MATVTYPADFPTNGIESKKHLNRLCNWLRSCGVAGVWLLEFQKRGAPHYHLFLTKGVNAGKLRAAWARIVSEYLKEGEQAYVHLSEPMSRRTMLRYATKTDQKAVPDGYENIGQFWGKFGLPKLEPIVQFVTTAHEAAPIIRAMKRGVYSRCKRRPRRLDRGKNSFRLFSGSRFFFAYKRRVEGLPERNE